MSSRLPGLCQADYQVCVKQTTRSLAVSCSVSVLQRVAACCQTWWSGDKRLERCNRSLCCVLVLSDATGVCVASLLSNATGACAIRVPSHSYQWFISMSSKLTQWFISMSSKVTQWRRRRRYPSTLHAAAHLTSRTCAFAYLRTYRILPLMKVQVDRHRHR